MESKKNKFIKTLDLLANDVLEIAKRGKLTLRLLDEDDNFTNYKNYWYELYMYTEKGYLIMKRTTYLTSVIYLDEDDKEFHDGEFLNTAGQLLIAKEIARDINSFPNENFLHDSYLDDVYALELDIGFGEIYSFYPYDMSYKLKNEKVNNRGSIRKI